MAAPTLEARAHSGPSYTTLLDSTEHCLALAMVLAVETLYASLAEEGLLQCTWRSSGPLEPCRIVEDTGGLDAGHAGRRPQQEPGQEGVCTELGGPARDETVGIAKQRDRAVGRLEVREIQGDHPSGVVGRRYPRFPALGTAHGR